MTGICELCATGASYLGPLCAASFARHLCTQLGSLVCPLLALAAPDCPALDCDWYCSAVGW